MSREDIKVVVRLLREKYLKKFSLNQSDQEVIKKLNNILADRFLLGDNSFEVALRELVTIEELDQDKIPT